MNYHNITHDDMLNGDGLRVVLWVSGCSHHCPGCQNPVTWNPDDGLIFDENAWEELEDLLDKDYISGLTLSGGDPLFEGNRSDILKLCEIAKSSFPEKKIWLYTGYVYEDIEDLEILNYVDVLVDGPYIEKLRDTSLKWIGSSNQRVIDVKETKKTGCVILHTEG